MMVLNSGARGQNEQQILAHLLHHPLGFYKPENPGGWTDSVNVDTFSCQPVGKYIGGVTAWCFALTVPWEAVGSRWCGCLLGRHHSFLLSQDE